MTMSSILIINDYVNKQWLLMTILSILIINDYVINTGY